MPHLTTGRCRGCGQPIGAQWIEALGSRWHAEHFTCVSCGDPIGDQEFMLVGNRPAHPACYERGYTGCLACGSATERSALRWLAGGVELCPDCATQAVGARQAARIYAEGVRWAAAIGLLARSSQAPPLRLVSRWGLTPSLRGTCLGLTEWSTSAGAVAVREIRIARGLPSVLFEGTVAHELAHAFLAANRVDGPPRHVEGFCELAAYHRLDALGGKVAEARRDTMRSNPDRVYGDGFREAMRRAERRTLRDVVESVRQSRRLR